MSSVTSLIAAALDRLGMQQIKERGWSPRSNHVKRALEALGRDDLDQAIEDLERATREEPGEETEVAREVILIRLDVDEERINAREAEAKRFRDAAEGEITVLDLRLRRVRFNYRARQVWVALAAAAAVVVSSVISVTRFGLDPRIAGVGLLVFAAGAALLIIVDRRRQRAEHEVSRAQTGAEVAEEIQILRHQVRSRESEIDAARADRERLRARRARVTGGPPAQPTSPTPPTPPTSPAQ